MFTTVAELMLGVFKVYVIVLLRCNSHIKLPSYLKWFLVYSLNVTINIINFKTFSSNNPNGLFLLFACYEYYFCEHQCKSICVDLYFHFSWVYPKE